MSLNFRKGFTLIELITVIAVMGTLVGVSATSYNGYRDMAEKEEAKLAIQQVKNAVDNYYSANEIYPTLPDLSNQPTPDTTTTDSAGQTVVNKGYSEINIDELINQRFLQEEPKLKDGQFFAIHYNGLVTVEEEYTTSLIIENGLTIVPKKDNNTLDFVVHTDTNKNVSKVVVTETTSNGGSLSGASSVVATKGNDGKYTGKIKLATATPGAKYFKATITYSDGTVVVNASIEYAMSADSINEKPYWISNPSASKADNIKINPQIASVRKTDNSIVLDWTNNPIESYTYMISAYEITKTYTDNDGKEVSEKIMISKGMSGKSMTVYEDTEIQGGKTYKYTIKAYSNGNGLETENYIQATVQSNSYKDTTPYFYNVTKNNYQASSAETIMFNLGDKEGITLGKNAYGLDGAAKVKVHVGQVSDGKLIPTKNGAYYTTYELTSANIVATEKKTIQDSSGKKVDIDVATYALSVEVLDDYIVYWIEVIDNRTYRTYFYYNSELKQESSETLEQAEDRRTVTSKTHPDDSYKNLNEDKKLEELKNNKWSIMRGLRKIHEDSFIDDSKLDRTKSTQYKLYNGKIYLP